MRRFAVLLALVACSAPKPLPPSDLAPPLPIVQPKPDDVLACAHLALIGCTGEAWPAHGTCVQAMSELRTLSQVTPDAGMFDSLSCIIAATDPASVRKCGGVGTLTITCTVDAGP